jgi:hypothetical protein
MTVSVADTPSVEIRAVHLTGLDQQGDCCPVIGSGVVADEEGVFAVAGQCCITRAWEVTSASSLTLCHALDLGGTEGREAVHERDADVEFGSLAAGVSDRDALSEGF